MLKFFTLFFICPFLLFSQISTTNSPPFNSPEYIVNDVLLQNSLQTSNISSVGFSEGIGYFDGTNSNIGLEEGIILSTGGVDYVSNGTPGISSGISDDPDLELALNQINIFSAVNNVTILEFDFVAQTDILSFNYVFGSSEYTGYTCSVYNDIFGFFLSGPGINGIYSNNAVNLAYVPDPEGFNDYQTWLDNNTGLYTNTPVAVNTVNSGEPTGGGSVVTCDNIDLNWESYNIFWYDNNYPEQDTYQGPNQPQSPEGTVLGIDGFTVPLNATYNALIPGETYHIKLAIADNSDSALNSVVFIEGGSFNNNYGCTYSSACNYNPFANFDDGSCEWVSCFGCSDPNACNFNQDATFDDGSCIYTDGICQSCLNGEVVNNDFDNDGICDSEDLCQGFDDNLDFDNDLIPDACDICPNDFDNDIDNDGVCGNNEVFGCTYDIACNYNPEATEDDGSCLFSFIDECEGCTDFEACNYNPNANSDDGSCNYDSCIGCTDFTACNYDQNATEDDGSCIYPNICGSCENNLLCFGCTDSDACNYNPESFVDDGSCEYPEFGFNCDGVFIEIIDSEDLVLCNNGEPVELIVSNLNEISDEFIGGIVTADDIYSNIIDIGFDFEFYGNFYNSLVISSNNYLSFDTENAGAYSPYAINEPIPQSGSYSPLNSVLAPWQDTNPNVGGEIGYTIIGEAPNRVFIASFCDVGMFSCTDFWSGTQIKLYESSNVIETHIVNKDLCENWNEGAAIHGLQNIDGTIANIVTGLDGIERNYPNQWTASEDAWRFSPNGNNGYNIESILFSPSLSESIVWQDQNGNIIGSGNSITVYPEQNTSYSAISSYCNNANIIVEEVTIFLEECQGCTDPLACNYDNLATDNDGSCTYPDELYLDCNGECLLEIISNTGLGNLALINNDNDDDGICNQFDNCPNIYNPDQVDINNNGVGDLCENIFGCTDPIAYNYDPLANQNDGSCLYLGCTEETACNYDSTADIDDGSCVFPGLLCELGDNIYGIYNDLCQCVDVIYGCMDENACNYNQLANIDNENCFYPQDECTLITDLWWQDPYTGFYNSSCECIVYGCTDDLACNYDAGVNTDDGSCIYDPIYSSEIISCTDGCNGSVSVQLNEELSCFYCTWYAEQGNVVSYYCNLDNACAGEYTLIVQSDCNLSSMCQEQYFEINCNSTAVKELSKTKKIILKVDVLGREVNNKNSDSLILYIYDDGSVDKNYNLTNDSSN